MSYPPIIEEDHVLKGDPMTHPYTTKRGEIKRYDSPTDGGFLPLKKKAIPAEEPEAAPAAVEAQAPLPETSPLEDTAALPAPVMEKFTNPENLTDKELVLNALKELKGPIGADHVMLMYPGYFEQKRQVEDQLSILKGERWSVRIKKGLYKLAAEEPLPYCKAPDYIEGETMVGYGKRMMYEKIKPGEYTSGRLMPLLKYLDAKDINKVRDALVEDGTAENLSPKRFYFSGRPESEVIAGAEAKAEVEVEEAPYQEPVEDLYRELPEDGFPTGTFRDVTFEVAPEAPAEPVPFKEEEPAPMVELAVPHDDVHALRAFRTVQAAFAAKNLQIAALETALADERAKCAQLEERISALEKKKQIPVTFERRSPPTKLEDVNAMVTDTAMMSFGNTEADSFVRTWNDINERFLDYQRRRQYDDIIDLAAKRREFNARYQVTGKNKARHIDFARELDPLRLGAFLDAVHRSYIDAYRSYHDHVKTEATTNNGF